MVKVERCVSREKLRINCMMDGESGNEQSSRTANRSKACTD